MTRDCTHPATINQFQFLLRAPSTYTRCLYCFERAAIFLLQPIQLYTQTRQPHPTNIPILHRIKRQSVFPQHVLRSSGGAIRLYAYTYVKYELLTATF